MPLKSLRDRLGSQKLHTVFGTITKISPTVIVAEGLHVSIGDTVTIVSDVDAHETMGMVSEVERNRFFITPFRFVEGFRAGDKVFPNQNGMSIEVGDGLLGRVV
ncbi:MAG: EscN/YscN/HrcN family type III secretion system ATPase, partial [Sulfuricurvum sp.]|nr:EscN/YscN/HrcN family type III secretion system ATPase [Sulfuricurvum sp.]